MIVALPLAVLAFGAGSPALEKEQEREEEPVGAGR